MNSLVSSFSGMPKPLQAGISLFSGGAITAAVMLAFSGNMTVSLVIVGGMALLATMLIGYRAILKWRQKAKANPFLRDIAESSSAVPQGAEAATRASLDDMRKKFEEGLATFRTHGKNLYSLPWYAFVGEPGSGKTELIRHCNVGFPPGLQDRLQGVGGTVNMHWWFTDHAVILDTAGKMVMAEDDSPASTLWTEFLKLLARHRPNCPLNGLLLSIPVDSLIKDTSEDIERKAGRIARQLDHIQRALGVRFPVFVIITMSDKINGFREFFSDIGEIQFEHQMFGWSNPAPLDEPFKPEHVDQHLEQVRSRLIRRRFAVLRDPVHTEDQNARRVDQVDSLFAFPNELAGLAPRLRRYLEMIFVGGTWATKPLFLRGIYFTSAMTEGKELDEELAKLHGVSVESLPGGRGGWSRDKAYFIRDVFLSKVFREKGLVTRASNTKRLQHRRKRTLLAVGGGGLALVAALTAWSWMELNDTIIKPTDFWVSASESIDKQQKNNYHGIVQYRGTYVYGGADSGHINGDQFALVEAVKEVHDRAYDPLHVNWGFSLANGFSRELLGDQRQAAGRAFFEKTILEPLIRYSRKELRKEDDWDMRAIDALVQLTKLQVAQFNGNNSERPLQLAPLINYLVSEPHSASFVTPVEDITNLQRVLEKYYMGQGRDVWPPKLLQTDTALNLGCVTDAIDNLIDSGKLNGKNQNTQLGKIALLANALSGYCSAEWALLQIDDHTSESATLDVQQWELQYQKLVNAYDDFQPRVSILNGQSLEKSYTDAKHILQLSYQSLLEELKQLPADIALDPSPALISLQNAKTQLEKVVSDLKSTGQAVDPLIDQYTFYDRAYLQRGTREDAAHVFEERYTIYQIANDQLRFSSKATFESQAPEHRWLEISTLNDNIKSRIASARSAHLPASGELGKPNPDPCNSRQVTHGLEASRLFEVALRSAEAGQKRELIALCCRDMPNSLDSLKKLIANQSSHSASATSKGEPLHLPDISFTRLANESERSIDVHYNVEGAAKVFRSWKGLSDLCGPPSAVDIAQSGSLLQDADLKQEIEPCRNRLNEYLAAYIQYWGVDVPKLAVPESISGPWDGFVEKLAVTNITTINGRLVDVQERVTGCFHSAQICGSSVFKERSEEIEKYLNFASQYLDSLQNVKHKIHFQTIRDNWTGLGNNSAAAAAKILRLTPTKFEENYIDIDLGLKSHNSADETQQVTYWEQLPRAALDLLAKANTDQALQALKKLQEKSEYRRFPLCIDSQDPPLSIQEFRDAQKVFEQLGSISGVTANARFDEGTIGAGALTKNQPVDKSLKMLTGRDFMSEDQIELQKKIAPVLALDNFQWELIILDDDDQRKSPEFISTADRLAAKDLGEITSPRPYVEVYVGESFIPNTLGERRIQAAIPTDLTKQEEKKRFNLCECPQISFTFHDTHESKDTELREVKVSQGWSILPAIHRAEFSRKTDKDSNSIWRVPLLVVNSANSPTHYYWVGCKIVPKSPEHVFPKDLLERENWPKLEDWKLAFGK